MTPSFQSMWRTTRARPRRFTFAIAACVLVLILATSIVLLRRPARTEEVVSVPVQWRGPTDFLLDTPGSSLVRGTPALSAPVPNYSVKGIVK